MFQAAPQSRATYGGAHCHLPPAQPPTLAARYISAACPPRSRQHGASVGTPNYVVFQAHTYVCMYPTYSTYIHT